MLCFLPVPSLRCNTQLIQLHFNIDDAVSLIMPNAIERHDGNDDENGIERHDGLKLCIVEAIAFYRSAEV
jgi:hypothetical protein